MASMLYLQVFWVCYFNIRFTEPWTTERVLNPWRRLP